MRILLILTGLALAACASTNEPVAKSEKPADVSGSRGIPTRAPAAPTSEDELEEFMLSLPATASGGAALPGIVKDYLPFIDVAMNPYAASAAYGTPLEDQYTRIRVETLNPKATDMEGTASGSYTTRKADRDYKKESRGWLSRMMSSRSVSRTLLVEFELNKPDVKATEALFSASFSSNRQDGESWSTDQSLSLYATPWFRVTSNTTMTAKLRMQLADQRESTGASANVIGALTNAANLIAPTSSLITYFNAPAMLEASNFLDSSVSTLFGRSITEQSTGTIALKTWTESPVLVVYAAMPDARDIRKTKKREMLGGWAIYLEAPILSMFTSATQYNDLGDGEWPDYNTTSGAEMLAFKIGDELTVYDYIFSRLDLADRIAMLNETGDAGLARLICTRIDRGMSETGFNSWDSAAAVWATATSDQIGALAQEAILQPETCPAMERWFSLQVE